MDLGKLKHPAWTGIVFPLVLAIVSTFSPNAVRDALLIIAVIAATWTFSGTEFAKHKITPTLIACGVFAALGMGVFMLAHVHDAHARAEREARKAKGTISTPTAFAQINNAPNGTVVGGPVTVQSGAVASFGQQGGITAGKIDINPLPAERPSAKEIAKELTTLQQQPTGPLVNPLTDQELKLRTRVITGELREFGRKVDAESSALTTKYMLDISTLPSPKERAERFFKNSQDIQDLMAKQKGDFVFFRIQALKLRNELKKRVGNEAPEENYAVRSLLEDGFQVTARNLNAAADYLDILAEEIPWPKSTDNGNKDH